jgi:HEAT repeat protein
MDKRANAIQALGLASGDMEAVRLAEDALGDKEALVRGAAAKALGALGSPESIPKLQKLLADKDISVALAVGHALVQLKSNSGLRRLLFPGGWRSEGQNITDHRRTEPNEDSGEGHPVCV